MSNAMEKDKFLKDFAEISDAKIELFKFNIGTFFSNKANIRVTEGLQINNIISKKCNQNRGKILRCLEIGSGAGGSTFSIIAGNKNIQLDTVDISYVNINTVARAILPKIVSMPEISNITFHVTDSLDFLDMAINSSVIYDFVLIDGSHDYDHVCKEVKKIMKVTNSKSFLFFDDSYKNSEIRKGVFDAIKENISKRKFLEGHYIGKEYYDKISKREKSIFDHDMRSISRIEGVWKSYINHPDRWYAKDASPYHFIQCFPGSDFK